MITIAHISDVHFGDACAIALRNAHLALRALNPDCVVVTGDITQAGRRTEFAEAAAWFAQISAPLVVCPGNHDAPVYSVLSRMIHPYRRFARLGLASAWADPAGRAAVVAWNSARAIQPRLDWSQGVHTHADVSRALQKAQQLSPHGWRILACHHPPGAPDGAAIRVATKNAAMTRAQIRTSPHTVLLCGHVHRYAHETVGAATLVTAPTLASSRARGGGRGFVVLRINQDAAMPELIVF